MIRGISLFFIQAIIAFIATFSVRAIAQGNYEWTIYSELIIGAMVYLSIKEIVNKANPVAKFIGYICGGVIGSIFGIFISKIILKQ